MIVVIADDITGAAEIAGICLRYGLKIIFALDELPNQDADVIILACDSRSEKEIDAAKIHTHIANDLNNSNYEWIFKKCDSVLRGYVISEIEALTKIFHVKVPWIVPVNPATGRIIRQGEYLIDEIPLHKTAFSNDPDFPARTSCVNELIADRNNVRIPFEIPDCENQDKLINLAEQLQHEKLFTGSSAWFHEILLKKMYFNRKDAIISSRKIENFIVFNGSLHPSGKAFLNTSDNKYPIEIIPPELYLDYYFNSNIAAFQQKIRHAFEVSGGLFLFQHPDVIKYCNNTIQLINRTMQIIENILTIPEADQWMITGGATCYALLKNLNIKILIPEEELAPGVLNFRIPGKKIRKIAVKPGSYPWGVNFI